MAEMTRFLFTLLIVLSYVPPSWSFLGFELPISSQKVFLRNKWVRRRHDPFFLRQSASTIIEQEDNAREGADQPSQPLDELKFPADKKFFLPTALFCGGLAFDAYVEPPPNSARWEKGSQGMKVAFCSAAFTRQIYKGLVEVTPRKCTGLPEDESAVERIISGKGVDACLHVAALEGSWKEDVELLEKEQYHQGIWDLAGAAHVGKSSTAWAYVDEKQSQENKRRRGRMLPYHVPGSWGQEGQAIWPEEQPFYLYVQDPATVRLVFTVVDADRVGKGSVVGSTHKRLTELIPQAGLTQQQLIQELKGELLAKVKAGDLNALDDDSIVRLGAKTWQGELKLISKPRKKDKKGQMLAGAAAGAAIGGPAGAAVGALAASFYEGEVQGTIDVKLRYLPVPDVPVSRKVYSVLGGMPGINWGELFARYRSKINATLTMDDLEHCFFINHDVTGASCAVYRSVEKKAIIVSFRGTCRPIDLLTDATITQDTWVEGEDSREQATAKVHAGFRKSLDSISRRLKELLLAAAAPGEALSDYDMLITGHSLGGALATLFTADIGEYGIDAGRGLPQLIESEPWWKSIANTVMGQIAQETSTTEPPRPKSLRMYNFGSPRVGNVAFASLFDALRDEGHIDEAYRIVNGEDVVTRLPRTLNALMLGQVSYEHVGTTALVTEPQNNTDTTIMTPNHTSAPLLWIEGESDESDCPVRDGVALSSMMAEGTLLADLANSTRELRDTDGTSLFSWSKLSQAASSVSDRLSTLTASDVASILGVDRRFSEREIKMVQSLLQGKALAHHMEDQYYAAMGRACGFLARVGEEFVELKEEQ